jgi:uncharacterized NAD(P)/FAD-binding protein YdhS
MGRVIVIIGAGFSGTSLAVRLLKRPQQVSHVVLVERGGAFGRGIAYADRPHPFLLNVPASRLSAEASEPQQFLEYARRTHPEAGGEDFLPRSLYGAYLSQLLDEAEQGRAPGLRFDRLGDEVVDVRRAAKGAFSVHFAGREPLRADVVVLACGNPPASWMPWTDRLKDHPAVRENPWDLPTPTREQTVLIVGNGLTMADVALALSADDTEAPRLVTVSRRGLVPQPQTEFRTRSLDHEGAALLAHTHSLRRLLATFRSLVHRLELHGGDWREAITYLRGLAPRIWRELPLSERARFVRHLQAHWDVHRHRLPPAVALRLRELQAMGKLTVNAGRIQSAVAQGARVRVTWQPRGVAPARHLLADYIINASGPDFVLERSREPLLHSLRSQGLIAADALRLGIRTGEHCACVDSFGQASRSLFYVGPMLRADHWEATAATELRDHAQRLAHHLATRGEPAG